MRGEVEHGAGGQGEAAQQVLGGLGGAALALDPQEAHGARAAGDRRAAAFSEGNGRALNAALASAILTMTGCHGASLACTPAT